MVLRIRRRTMRRSTMWRDIMRKIAIVTAALVSAGILTTAQAGGLGRPCTSAPESTWLSLSALKAKAESLGYKVEKAKLKAACGEVYARDGNGVRTELFLDPTSGAVVAKQ
jgi:hypothetical protein